MDERTNKFIAEWYLSGKPARDYCDWAIECLEKGLDSKNIRILASMFQNEFSYENETYFRKSLNDLHWEFPTEEKCLKRYGKLIAKKIIDDEIEPLEGFSLMQKIYYDSNYNDDFVDWGYLYVHEDTMSKEEFRAEIKKEADNFLRDGKIKFLQNVEEKPLFDSVDKNDTFIEKIRKLF